jgi:hypothetical protein
VPHRGTAHRSRAGASRSPDRRSGSPGIEHRRHVSPVRGGQACVSPHGPPRRAVEIGDEPPPPRGARIGRGTGPAQRDDLTERRKVVPRLPPAVQCQAPGDHLWPIPLKLPDGMKRRQRATAR